MKIKPRSLLNILGFLAPFLFYFNFGALPISWAYIAIFIISGLILLFVFVTQQKRFVFPRQVIPMGMLLVLILISFTWAVDKTASLIFTVQILAYYVVFFLVTYLLRSVDHLESFIKSIILGGLLNSLIAIFQYVIFTISSSTLINFYFYSPFTPTILGARNLERLGDYGELGPLILNRGASIESLGNIFRSFGFFEGPTVFGWFCVGISLITITYAFSDRFSKISKKIKLSCAILSVIPVLLSLTRSAWLAEIVGILIILVSMGYVSNILKYKKTVFFAFGAILVLFVGLYIASPQDSFLSKFLNSFISVNSSGSNIGRLETINLALDLIGKSPWVGVGFGNIANAFNLGFSSELATFATSHNTFLDLAIELGVQGSLVYLWLILGMIFGAYILSRKKSTPFHPIGVACLAFWVSYVIICMFGGNIIHPKWMTLFWMISGFQAAAFMVKATLEKTTTA